MRIFRGFGQGRNVHGAAADFFGDGGDVGGGGDDAQFGLGEAGQEQGEEKRDEAGKITIEIGRYS